MNFELPKSTVRKTTLGLLELITDVTVENSKKVLNWFKALFTTSNEKGLKATLMGPFVGILNILDSLGKGGAPQDETLEAPIASPPSPETRNQLDTLRSATKKGSSSENEGREAAREAPLPTPQIRGQLDTLRSSLPSLLDHTQLKSAPFDRDKQTKTTLCSTTALINLQKMGCSRLFRATTATASLEKDPNALWPGVPAGNAVDVKNFYNKSRHHTKFKGPNPLVQLNNCKENLADILVKSSSRFGHRAVAFKSENDDCWYILDPYRPPYDIKPIPFEEYNGEILFAIPIVADIAPSIALVSRPPKAAHG